MFAKIGVAALGFLMVSAVPAFAQFSGCVNPIAPAAIDGSKATEQQMKDARDDVMNFQKASDDYQQCLNGVVNQAKTEATKHAGEKDAKPFDPNIEKAADARSNANQKMKEKVVAEFNAAVQGYKTAHPGK